MSKIVSFAGLIITLFVAYACDRWVELLRVEATQNFAIASYLWIAGAANLLLAIAVLLLTWYVLLRVSRSNVVYAVFVLVGLALTFAEAIEISVASTLPPLGIYEYLLPTSHVLAVAALVAVIGIAGLVFPRRQPIQESSTQTSGVTPSTAESD